MCRVVVCDLETSRMGAPYIYDISRLRVKWTRPFHRKTKSGFCACAVTFQTQSIYLTMRVSYLISHIVTIREKRVETHVLYVLYKNHNELHARSSKPTGYCVYRRLSKQKSSFLPLCICVPRNTLEICNCYVATQHYRFIYLQKVFSVMYKLISELSVTASCRLVFLFTHPTHPTDNTRDGVAARNETHSCQMN